MRLLDSSLYNADLKKAVSSIDLSSLDGKSFFITGRCLTTVFLYQPQ